jgi:hypothetical protein
MNVKAIEHKGGLMPQIIQPTKSKHRVLIYGVPKGGKTRLATSLDWADEETWGKKALYFAWDAGSESLSSVRKADREHLIVVTPEPKVKRIGKEEYLEMNPHEEAHLMATRDWKKELPDVGTIIWDTYTDTAVKLLRGYANAGALSGAKGDQHISVGTKGGDDYMAFPMIGDYAMTGLNLSQILDSLFEQPLNIIVICHADISNPNPEVSNVTFGGPATVGQKAIATIAGKFDNLFRTDKRTAKAPAKGVEYMVYTEGRGIWLGGMRTSDNCNPLPEFSLGSSERVVDGADFWRKFTEIQRG